MKGVTKIDIRWILAPLLGGLIGYITNAIAIRMLFRPRREYHIGRFHVPFTPGLIPREKARIARSIGHTVSQNLLDTDTLRSALLSDAMQEKLVALAARILQKARENDTETGTALQTIFGETRYENAVSAARGKAAAYLAQKAKDANLGESVAVAVAAYAREKMNGVWQMFVPAFAEDGALTRKIARFVDDYVATHADEFARNMVNSEAEHLLKTPLRTYVAHVDGREDALFQWMTSLYERLVESALPAALHAIDISSIIEEKVASLDNRALEEMIFGIMKRELNAIVCLGAVLGTLMGFLNLLL